MSILHCHYELVEDIKNTFRQAQYDNKYKV
jgi:hypothetical protein